MRSFGEPIVGFPTANQGHDFTYGAVLHLTVSLGADWIGRTYDSSILPHQLVNAD